MPFRPVLTVRPTAKGVYDALALAPAYPAGATAPREIAISVSICRLGGPAICPNEIVPITSVRRIDMQRVDRTEGVRLFPTWSNAAC